MDTVLGTLVLDRIGYQGLKEDSWIHGEESTFS